MEERSIRLRIELLTNLGWKAIEVDTCKGDSVTVKDANDMEVLKITLMKECELENKIERLQAEVKRLNARVKDWESAYQAQKERADYLQIKDESNAD